MTTRAVEQATRCNYCQRPGVPSSDPLGYYDWFGWRYPLHLHELCAKEVKAKLWGILGLKET